MRIPQIRALIRRLRRCHFAVANKAARRVGRTGPAKNVLTAFATRADAAFQQGALSDAEHRFLAENARYLVARL